MLCSFSGAVGRMADESDVRSEVAQTSTPDGGARDDATQTSSLVPDGRVTDDIVHTPSSAPDEADLSPRTAADLQEDRKSTRLNSSHVRTSRMPSSA